MLPEPLEGGGFDHGFGEDHGLAVLRLSKKSIENQGVEHAGIHLGGLRLKKKLGPERHVVPVAGGGLGDLGGDLAGVFVAFAVSGSYSKISNN